MEGADFSGYATRANLECSDGRTIMPEAFQHMDGKKVPLVWHHNRSTPENVLGHAILEARPDGMYAWAFFNETPSAQHAKVMVRHKDVESLSIFANQLLERGKKVYKGLIHEVSLVMAGANPGAFIDNIALEHGGEVTLLDEAIIYTGLAIVHSEELSDEIEEDDEDQVEDNTDDSESSDVEKAVKTLVDSFSDEEKAAVANFVTEATSGEAGSVDEAIQHASEKSMREVYEAFSEEQKAVVHYIVALALDEGDDSAEHSADSSDEDAEDDNQSDDNQSDDSLSHQEGSDFMKRNVFEGNGLNDTGPSLSHDQMSTILADARQPGQTLKSSFLAHAEEYGITDIELLFPDAKALNNTPEFISRRMGWVSKVLGGTRHAPFSKIKTTLADITADEARAKGYTKGGRKVEEVFGLLQRSTSPATIYKKQKLDRDDIIDITDIDVVAFLKAEMRLMIEEEVARAILVGDGRSNMSPDKVKDPAGANDGAGIRSILNDDDLYAIKHELAANVSAKDAVKGMVRARSKYRGSGKPTLFISDAWLTELMLEEDKFGRPLYETEQVLADKLRVSAIETVDVFEEYPSLFAIMVNLADYTVGATRGGELTSFEDFDIDFNQNKYLQETRLSGALTKPFSAIVVFRAEGTLATAVAPSYNGATKTITIPTTTGVNYLILDEVVTGDVVIDKTTEVEAEAKTGYYLEPNKTDSWTFTV